jgi:head-tail adaptor
VTLTVDIGSYQHDVVLRNPDGPPVPDGDGDFTQPFTDLAALWWASIKPATARDLERVVAGTVLATATHIVRMQYLAGVTTKTEVLMPAPTFASRPEDEDWSGRTLHVTGVTNPDEANVELVLACAEVVA